ncbi:F420-dependent oxidoreductase [Streptomyces sp. CNQ-509]|uniref:TIGR03619 family F420-dependent LLM class oxidoreductase n=1 Tax=unclassified Streptomyces TaxID=2593676 RepID=UPI00062DE6BA|nr:TIGR03619 family F420-dependent LLM class oxidoreductase [Streptomyces sp. CNQ-509]AKH82959.1 F420-dependent oxidoreductase [Streptomyces sp. CNQ-509]
MRISVTVFLTDETVRPPALARELEERGFHGLYLPEHTHIPVSRDTPAPMGEPLPREYGRTLDPFVALGQAAAVTERLALGTGITLVAQHDPIVLAKQVATLDFLSGGRLTLGVGFGWNEEEADDHGVDWRGRRELGRRKMGLMNALWAPEPTAYDGEAEAQEAADTAGDEAGGSVPRTAVRASEAHPKPVQAPRPRKGAPPLHGPRTLLGGRPGPKLFAHVAEYADGWMPIGGGGLTDSIPRLRQVWEDAGRDPAALEVVPYAVRPSEGKLAYFAAQGVRETVVQLPPAGETEVLRALDAYAQFL